MAGIHESECIQGMPHRNAAFLAGRTFGTLHHLPNTTIPVQRNTHIRGTCKGQEARLNRQVSLVRSWHMSQS